MINNITTTNILLPTIFLSTIIIFRFRKLNNPNLITAAKNKNDDDNDPNTLLSYWFSNIQSANKTIWFVEEGPQRDAIDVEIQQKFGHLVQETIISQNKGLIEWEQHNNVRIKLALILVLDQLSRHVLRKHPNKDNILLQLNSRARQIVTTILDQYQPNYKELLRDFHPAEICFLLMPFRHHTLHATSLERVLDVLDTCEEFMLQHKIVLERFKRATEASLATCPQETKRTYRDEDILEPSHPIPNNNTTTRQHMYEFPIYKAVQDFMKRLSPCPHLLLVSLSGGVDSMVLSTILCDLKIRNIIPSSTIIAAAHVNYGNRPEANAEADFVRRWCELHQIDFHCKRMGEDLLRGITERDEYEKRSKELRFGLYKQVWGQYHNLNSSNEITTTTTQVFFGHHQGDIVENVLSNSLKGRTLLELSGMTESSDVLNVQVLRPMLSLPKSAIYDLAHTFNVPYFLDSTPRWSTRGQVRNEVLPTLARVYGTGFSDHLVRLARQSDDLYEYLNKDISRAIVEFNRGESMAATILDLNELKPLPLFLWKLAFRRACHEGVIPTPRDKAVETIWHSFTDVTKPSPGLARAIWVVEIRSEVMAAIFSNRYLVVFKGIVGYEYNDKEEGNRYLGVGKELIMEKGTTGCMKFSIRVVDDHSSKLLDEIPELNEISYFNMFVCGGGTEKRIVKYRIAKANKYVVIRGSEDERMTTSVFNVGSSMYGGIYSSNRNKCLDPGFCAKLIPVVLPVFGEDVNSKVNKKNKKLLLGKDGGEDSSDGWCWVVVEGVVE
jgi:tRNA(Ile)-lysidine synthetase-like protein